MSCDDKDKKQALSLFNKEITFHNELYSVQSHNSIFIPNNEKYKIVMYIDSIMCLSCNLNYQDWSNFKNYIQKVTNDNVQFAILLHANYNKNKAAYDANTTDLPFYIDTNDQFLNSNIKDNKYKCFLLNPQNHIVLIGDPVRSPQIQDLYIRTLVKKLNIEQPIDSLASERTVRSLGVFSWDEEQQTSFTIQNESNDIMHIDSIYTSCECTTATIDKREIAPNEKAIVNVTFKADKPEQFMREIYADVRGGEQIVMVIEGEAK